MGNNGSSFNSEDSWSIPKGSSIGEDDGDRSRDSNPKDIESKQTIPNGDRLDVIHHSDLVPNRAEGMETKAIRGKKDTLSEI